MTLPSQYAGARAVVLASTALVGLMATSGAAMAVTYDVAPRATIAGGNTLITNPAGVSVDAAGNVFVSSYLGNRVSRFVAGQQGNVAPTSNLEGATTGINRPQGIGVSSDGRLFVPQVNGRVLGFQMTATGNVAPSTNLTGASNAQSVAFDSAGNMYVADLGGTIRVYGANRTGAAAPIRQITGLSFVHGIAIDGSDRLYVANTGNKSIDVFAPGASGAATPLRRIVGANTGLASQGPGGIAVDRAGNTYVITYEGPAKVDVFASGANGNVAPFATIAGANTNMESPVGVAIGPDAAIYVTNSGTSRYVTNNGLNGVTVYASPFLPGAPTGTTATTPSAQETSVAFSAPGSDGGFPVQSYTATCASGDGGETRTGTAASSPITVGSLSRGASYACTVTATNAVGASTPSVASASFTVPNLSEYNLAPQAAIAGTSTLMQTPVGIWVEGDGAFFVTNYTANRVTSFPAGADGDVAPTTSLSGASTLISQPQGVAVDSNGRVFISQVNGDVLGFGRADTGNVAPTTRITGLSNSQDLDLDSAENLYVVEYGTGSVKVFGADRDGPAAPIRTVTGLSSPHGIGIDGNDYLYVANTGNKSIDVFAPDASGSATPVRRIVGANTGLATRGPGALEVDDAGNIYVNTYEGPNEVLVFRPGADGNAAPRGLLTGSDTLLASPTGLRIGPNAKIYVSNSGTNRYAANAGFNGVTIYDSPFVPDAPTAVAATSPNARSTSVSFTAPADDGGHSVDEYLVTCSSTTGGSTRSASGPASPLSVAGLTPGARYTCAVAAANAAGTSGPSTPSSEITVPPEAPQAPTAVSASPPETERTTVTFTPPTETGGSAIAFYTATCSSTAGGAERIGVGTASPIPVANLSRGATYTCVVTASNVAGESPASSPTNAISVPAVAPSAPTNVVATAGNAGAAVTWTGSLDDGGATILGYTATASPGGATCSTSGETRCTISGLTNGIAHTVTVTARNSAGTSPASEPSPGITPIAPNPPPACDPPPSGPVGISINGGATYTNSRRVTLSVVWPTCTTTFELANDGGFTRAQRQPTAQKVVWRLASSGPERLPKTVYLRFGSERVNYTDDIILDERAPVIISVSATGGQLATARDSAQTTRWALRIRAKDSNSGLSGMQVTTSRSRPGRVLPFAARWVAPVPGRRAFVRVQDRAGNWSPWRSVVAPR